MNGMTPTHDAAALADEIERLKLLAETTYDGDPYSGGPTQDDLDQCFMDNFDRILAALRESSKPVHGDAAALADRIKRHLRLTSLGLDTRALLEGAIAALRAPIQPVEAVDMEALSRWFNALPCGSLGKEHWDRLVTLLITSPPSQPALREAVIEECARAAEQCGIRFYPHNSSGMLAHQVDLAREDVVKAIRVLANNRGGKS